MGLPAAEQDRRGGALGGGAWDEYFDVLPGWEEGDRAEHLLWWDRAAVDRLLRGSVGPARGRGDLPPAARGCGFAGVRRLCGGTGARGADPDLDRGAGARGCGPPGSRGAGADGAGISERFLGEGRPGPVQFHIITLNYYAACACNRFSGKSAPLPCQCILIFYSI